MKKQIIKSVFCLLFLLNNNQLFSQAEDNKSLKKIEDVKNVQQWQGPHKYIVLQAYERLKDYLGYDIPEVKRHLGNFNDHGTGAFNPGNYIVTGAFREDEEDIVYGYTSISLGLLGSVPGATFTHFWKADNSDYQNTTFPYPYDLLGSFPNAYSKAKAFIDGGLNFSVGFRYDNLFTYYKTGNIKVGGINTNHTIAQRNVIVWEIIGRICHLLADVNTPAHVKNDPHFPPGFPTFGKYDFYEHEMDARYYNYTWQTAKAYGSLVPTVNTHPATISNSNTLKNLFYTSAQIADHFNSDDKGGNDSPGNNDPFGNYYVGTNSYGTLITLQTKINSLPPVSNNWSIPLQRYEINVDDVAEHCFHHSINATASLLLWCAHEMDIMPFVVPLQYPTIASAVQAVASSGRTVKDVLVLSGTHTITSNLVIPSGVNVTIEPSTTVNFNGGVTLQGTLEVKNGSILNFGNNMNVTISGSLSTYGATLNFASGTGLVVNGTADCQNTLFTGSYNWTGVILNSSTNFISNTIRYAITGLTLTTSTYLQGNNIHDCGTGLHISNTSVSLPTGNTIQNNNDTGVLFLGYSGGLFFPNNKIIYNELNISIQSNAHPDFGVYTGLNDQGRNSIYLGYHLIYDHSMPVLYQHNVTIGTVLLVFL